MRFRECFENSSPNSSKVNGELGEPHGKLQDRGCVHDADSCFPLRLSFAGTCRGVSRAQGGLLNLQHEEMSY